MSAIVPQSENHISAIVPYSTKTTVVIPKNQHSDKTTIVIPKNQHSDSNIKDWIVVRCNRSKGCNRSKEGYSRYLCVASSSSSSLSLISQRVSVNEDSESPRWTNTELQWTKSQKQ